MTKRKRKSRALPQRRGRALKGGARYPGGKLKPQAPEKIMPNLEVVKARKLMVGDPMAEGAQLHDAENPLDLAKRRRWITAAQHQAGVRLAETMRKAGLDLPSIRGQDFDRTIRGHSAALGDAKAMKELRAVSEAMRGWPKAWAAVFSLVILGDWPAWMIARVSGQAEGHRTVGRVQLVTGLALVGRALGIDGAMSRTQTEPQGPDAKAA